MQHSNSCILAVTDRPEGPVNKTAKEKSPKQGTLWLILVARSRVSACDMVYDPSADFSKTCARPNVEM